MDCKNCNAQLTEANIKTEIVGNEIDLLITCEDCGSRYGTFIPLSDLTDY